MRGIKRSLWLSALSLCLCVVTLLGTTFAWFTDSVTNKDNVIQAGELKIRATVYTWDAVNATWLTSPNYGLNSPLITEKAWEPGQYNAVVIQVSNWHDAATAALCAKIDLDFKITVNDKNLADALWYKLTPIGPEETIDAHVENVVTEDRLQYRDRRPASEADGVITMSKIEDDATEPVTVYTDYHDGQYVYYLLEYGMYTSADNKYMNGTFGLDFTVNAAQAPVEEDGFGSSDYDKDATFEGVVNTAEEFTAALQKGGEITLGKDIALTSPAVIPEGVTVSIDLGGKTISGYGIRNLGTIESLTNGTIVAASGYGLDNRATIGLLNCNITSDTSDAISNGTGTWQGNDYIGSNGVIEEIAGGSYAGHADVYDSSITGACGLYNGSNAVVKLISGGYFQGSSVAFRNYNKNGIECVTGGFFDCPYMDGNDRTFCDSTTIDEVFYNNAPLEVTGGTWYNVGSKINSKIPEGYELVQGDECEMTSRKAYVRYDADTNAPAHWVYDPDGTVYYYWTVEKN